MSVHVSIRPSTRVSKNSGTLHLSSLTGSSIECEHKTEHQPVPESTGQWRGGPGTEPGGWQYITAQSAYAAVPHQTHAVS